MCDKFYRITKIKPSPHSVASRLPSVYNKYANQLKRTPAPIHYIPEPGKWKLDPETNRPIRVENRYIPLKFPKEADEGIWGGEGVVHGFNKDKRIRRKYPTFWVPVLKKAIVYSEVLNTYMQFTVTERTLKLIDENHGFDNYLLQTPIQDLKSQLALSIRRKILLALVNREMYHECEEKNQEVYEKYKKFMIPKEEAEWFGLTEREAIQKQKLIEEETKPMPLKIQLRQKLLEELKAQEEESTEEESKSTIAEWTSKLNPFKSPKD